MNDKKKVSIEHRIAQCIVSLIGMIVLYLSCVGWLALPAVHDVDGLWLPPLFVFAHILISAVGIFGLVLACAAPFMPEKE